MAVIGGILCVIGLIIAIIFWIIILIKAFKESVLWGLGSLFIGPVWIVFAIMHWDECKSPFLKYVVGVVIYVIGLVMLMPALTATAS